MFKSSRERIRESQTFKWKEENVILGGSLLGCLQLMESQLSWKDLSEEEGGRAIVRGTKKQEAPQPRGWGVGWGLGLREGTRTSLPPLLPCLCTAL